MICLFLLAEVDYSSTSANAMSQLQALLWAYKFLSAPYQKVSGQQSLGSWSRNFQTPEDHISAGNLLALQVPRTWCWEPPGCWTLTLYPGLPRHMRVHWCAKIHFRSRHTLLANLFARWTHDRNRFSKSAFCPKLTIIKYGRRRF